jgi:hypothetical protein
MDSCLFLPAWVKRLTGFGLVGATVVLFVGPLLAALAEITVCVAIGFLMWLPLHTVFVGPHCPWKRAHRGGRQWQRRLASCYDVLQMQCRTSKTAVGAWWPVAQSMMREGFSGAICGGMLMAVAGFQEGPLVAAVLAGAVAGAVLGYNNSRQPRA